MSVNALPQILNWGHNGMWENALVPPSLEILFIFWIFPPQRKPKEVTQSYNIFWFFLKFSYKMVSPLLWLISRQHAGSVPKNIFIVCITLISTQFYLPKYIKLCLVVGSTWKSFSHLISISEYFIFKYKHIIGNFVCKAGVRKVPHFVTSGSHVDCLNLLLLRVPFPRFMLLLAWYSRALTLGELSQIILEQII